MMPYHTYRVAKYRMETARSEAENRRLRRAAITGMPGAYGAGVIDAIGHRLIALGTRLVADPTEHPNHRRAA